MTQFRSNAMSIKRLENINAGFPMPCFKKAAGVQLIQTWRWILCLHILYGCSHLAKLTEVKINFSARVSTPAACAVSLVIVARNFSTL